jgi:cytochrome c-type biogenesis protein CcmE
MNKKTARVGLTGLVLVLAFGGLLYTTLGESMEYYKRVDEIMANPAEWEGKALQLHGYARNVLVNPRTLEYRFEVHNNGAVIQASYTGVAPDTFKDDSEVVVMGMLQPDGSFLVRDRGILAKCPSKYEEQKAGVAAAPVTGTY